jgi:hypothetical protein
MFIHDFHSKLSSRSEDNSLFEALRRLRRLEDFRGLLFAEEEAGGGWYPWNDTGVPHPPVGVEA